MRSLIGFELKKVIGRRVARFTCAGVLLLLCGIMALNVVQTKADTPAGETLSGLEAIDYRRASMNVHAGELTPERVRDDLTYYRTVAFEKVDPAVVANMTDAAAYDLMVQAYDLDAQSVIFDSYYTYLTGPWRSLGMTAPYAADLDGDDGLRFYAAVSDALQAKLDAGMGGSWEYSEAERAYWTEKGAQVEGPFAYGYAGGWEDFLACMAFLAFAMVAVCVALAPVFGGEYQDGTDAVLLASRYGRSKLVAAKVIASLLFATGYFALAALIVGGVALGAFGLDGAGLPIQVLSPSIPYDLTMAQAAGIGLGLGYLMTVGFAALTLLLSARLRSALAVFAIDVALVFLTGLVPTGGSGILQHLTYLFPLNALVDQPLFAALVSYPLGFAVLDLVGMLLLVWGALILVSLPVAILAWRRHQVV